MIYGRMLIIRAQGQGIGACYWVHLLAYHTKKAGQYGPHVPIGYGNNFSIFTLLPILTLIATNSIRHGATLHKIYFFRTIDHSAKSQRGDAIH